MQCKGLQTKQTAVCEKTVLLLSLVMRKRHKRPKMKSEHLQAVIAQQKTKAQYAEQPGSMDTVAY
jgi:hypothetical protein